MKIRDDLNNPPTAVGGIYQFWMVRFVESDLNHPPTAVGGIYRFWMVRLVESDLNNPPTAVGGILIRSMGLPVTRACVSARIL
ncbi:MAG TPA: hypothetical protein VKB02_01475 [Pyrinomonadaceae bacterium]|nr:hypothetical protein [Pyrinomonadaceae bacterium]